MYSEFDSPGYRRSRNAYSWHCMLDYFVSILVSDVYLFKLLSYTGLSDGNIGLIASLGTFSSFFQLASIWLVRRIRNVKKWVITFCLSYQLILISLYFLPFLPFALPVRTVFAFMGVLLAYFFSGAISTILFQWANSYVDPHQRAVFSAEKEMRSLLGGMIFTFLLGMVMDRFELAGKLVSSFVLTICLGLFISSMSFIALMNIDGNWQPKAGASRGSALGPMFKALARNRPFLHVVVLQIFWTCAQCMTVGFLGSYKSKELMYSIGAIQIFNILGNAFRFVLSKPLGKFADHTSYSKCIEFGLCIAAAGFLAAVLASPDNRWLIIVFTLLSSISQAALSSNLFNIMYDVVPPEHFVQASAIRNCVGGVFGFLASLAGSRVLTYVQDHGNAFLGFPVYGQQLLAAASFLLCIGTALYVHKFLLKKRQMVSG